MPLRYSRLVAVVVLMMVLFLPLGCTDPQTAILKLFSFQGLTLIKPARDYIKIGGIVLLPKVGRMQYIDPYDSIPPDNGTSTNFGALIEAQTDNVTTGANASVALSSLVTLPLGFKFAAGQQVQLSQIDTGGTRYTSQKLTALLKQPDTAGAIVQLLKASKDNRVFVIQEVYTAKSISVKSSNNINLEASLGSAGTPPSCSTSSTGTTSSSSNGATAPSSTGKASSSTGTNSTSGKGSTSNGSGNGSASLAASTGTGTSVTISSSSSAANGNNATKSTSGASTNANSGTGNGTGTASTSSKTPSASVGVCRAESGDLSFTSPTAIPFAVRLNEVVLGPGDVVSVKLTGFRLPTSALGAENPVEATALINERRPVLEGFEHVTH